MTQSQHYAGVAFDVGQTLTASRRRALWNSANNSGIWSYVEPISLTPTWVRVFWENDKIVYDFGVYTKMGIIIVINF